MRHTPAAVLTLLVSACAAHAQMGRTLDWPTFSGDAQRTGWEKSDSKFTKDQLASGFQFLWMVKPDVSGNTSIMPPVIIGNLIGYRGFKELAFIAATDGSLHVMDSDLNRLYWKARFDSADKMKAGCPGPLSAMPTLMALAFRRPGPRPAGSPPARPTPNPMFGPRSIYVITTDGKLHRVNVADGSDKAPVPVLPPGAKLSTLNMNDSVIYTTSSAGCGSAPNAVWAIDISNPEEPPKVASFNSGGAAFTSTGGPVIGNDGTIYVQAGDGLTDPAAGKLANALIALSPKDLQMKGYFSAPTGSVTPVIFPYKERDLIVTATKDGRLNVLDSQSLGGADHKTALSQTAPLAASGGAAWGGLSTWEEQGGTRWVLATVWGRQHTDLKVPMNNGDSRSGSIVAFRLEEQGGKPVLTPAWSSRDLIKPSPPVIANGVVFALANGDRQTHATLYALDAANGKEMWSTGTRVTAAGNLTGLTIANGRVYFATTDNTLWTFGMPLEW